MAYVGNSIDVIKKLHSAQQCGDIVSFCKKMLDSDPKDLVALQNMATAFLNLAKFDDVVSCCDKVLSLNEFDEYALKNKILALEKLGRHAEIIPLCDKLLFKNPLNTWVLNSKGLAYNEIGKHDDAISYYDKTLSIEKNNVTALLNKAVTLSFLLKFEDAIQFYDLVQQQENQSRAAMAKSEAYHRLGKEDEAFLAAQGLLVSDIERKRSWDACCLGELACGRVDDGFNGCILQAECDVLGRQVQIGCSHIKRYCHGLVYRLWSNRIQYWRQVDLIYCYFHLV